MYQQSTIVYDSVRTRVQSDFREIWVVFLWNGKFCYAQDRDNAENSLDKPNEMLQTRKVRAKL